jgi:hypothetical protein
LDATHESIQNMEEENKTMKEKMMMMMMCRFVKQINTYS